MNKVLTIAFNTYKEAVRNKVFYILVVFAVGLLMLALLLATLSLGEDDRIIKDVGLSAINWFGLLLAVFVGVNLIYDELDKRTIYTIIASGATRWQFILGKFLGFFMTVTAMVAVMGFLLCTLIAFWPGSNITPTLILALILFLFEMMIVIGFAILFSSFSTPVLSAVLTLMCWIIGHLSEDLLEWSKQLSDKGSPAVAALLKGLYYIIPNLELYNIKQEVVYREDIGQLGYTVLLHPIYAVCATAILLLITIVTFNWRDFK
ncbi:MAG: hypothetical protein GC154_12405 [bacterium]|nr:hypothetical protein [bacterium]